MLNQKAIEEFNQIYFQEFGVRLSDREANERGLELISLFKAIYKPIPKKNLVYQELPK